MVQSLRRLKPIPKSSPGPLLPQPLHRRRPTPKKSPQRRTEKTKTKNQNLVKAAIFIIVISTERSEWRNLAYDINHLCTCKKASHSDRNMKSTFFIYFTILTSAICSGRSCSGSSGNVSTYRCARSGVSNNPHLFRRE